MEAIKNPTFTLSYTTTDEPNKVKELTISAKLFSPRGWKKIISSILASDSALRRCALSLQPTKLFSYTNPSTLALFGEASYPIPHRLHQSHFKLLSRHQKQQVMQLLHRKHINNKRLQNLKYLYFMHWSTEIVSSQRVCFFKKGINYILYDSHLQ